MIVNIMEKEIMKMMKKVLLILAVALIILMVGGVSGADVTQDNIKNLGDNYTVSGVEVVLTLDDVFTVTLPTGFVFEKDKDEFYDDNEPVKLYVGRLNETLKVNVSVNSSQYVANPDKLWNLTNKILPSNPAIQYLMKVGSSSTDHIEGAEDPKLVESDDVILSNSTSQDVYLHVKIPKPSGELFFTGKYTDILTFKVELVQRS